MRCAAATRKCPRAAGRVADAQREDDGLRVGSASGPIQHRVQRRVEQLRDQRSGRVVRAGGLALAAHASLEREAPLHDRRARVQLKQRLVDRSELLGAQGTVVDRPYDAVALDPGQVADGLEQMLVGQPHARQVRRHHRREQLAVQARQRQVRAARVRPQRLDDQRQHPPQVVVLRAQPPPREARSRRVE
jgi:hypothetical protein